MTLLERFDSDHGERLSYSRQEIRRALAVAQAVDEYKKTQTGFYLEDTQALEWIESRADELLREGGK